MGWITGVNIDEKEISSKYSQKSLFKRLNFVIPKIGLKKNHKQFIYIVLYLDKKYKFIYI